MKEDYENEKAELEIQSLKDCIQREREEFEIAKKCRVIDLHSMEQEVYRRNIEACMNVLRTGGTATSNGSMVLGNGVKTIAEDKLREFLDKLSVI